MQAVEIWLNGREDGQVKTLKDVKEKMEELKIEMKVEDHTGDGALDVRINFNYEDDAETTHEIVRGCRGTLWDFDGKVWKNVCATMDRFLNYGEKGAPEMLNLQDVEFGEKEDGSLVIRYWDRHTGKYKWKTRNTFDINTIKVNGSRNLSDILNKIVAIKTVATWNEPNVSWMFELCTHFNTVVVQHPVSRLVALSARSTVYPYNEIDISNVTGVERPTVFRFRTVDECKEFVNSRDPVKFEGVVAKFGTVQSPIRLKIKSKDFVAMSKTGKTDTPPPEQVIVAILKKDIAELLATRDGKWDGLAKYIQEKLNMFRVEIKKTDDALVVVSPNPPMSKKDEAEIIKKSVYPAYHFARTKFASLDLYLLKMEPIQVLKLIGAEDAFV